MSNTLASLELLTKCLQSSTVSDKSPRTFLHGFSGSGVPSDSALAFGKVISLLFGGASGTHKVGTL